MTDRLKHYLKRRHAIEPVIGHHKSDGLLDRSYLKGEVGDKMNVVLSAVRQNLRLILTRLRFIVSNY